MPRFDPARPAPVRFEALDSWRGICALMVAMMHFPASGPVSESAFLRHAFLFVDYFFVLSGFVIAHSFAPRLAGGLDYARFVMTRFGRIYPLHATVLVAFAGWEVARLLVPALRGAGPVPFSAGNTLPELMSSFALLDGLGLAGGLGWNGPSWSIAAEFWTYLLFGLAVLALGRRYWLALLPAIVAGPAILFLRSPDYMNATWDYGFVRCLYGFSLGALVYAAAGPGLVTAHRREPGRHMLWTAAECGALAAVAVFVAMAGESAAGLAAPFVFAAALLVFAREAGLVSRLLRLRAFLWLGALSYAIYIVHIFVQSRMINAASLVERLTGLDLVGDFTMTGERFYGFGVQGPLAGTLALGAMVVAVIAVALLAHVTIERPCQRLSKRFAARLGEPRPASPPEPLLAIVPVRCGGPALLRRHHS